MRWIGGLAVLVLLWGGAQSTSGGSAASEYLDRTLSPASPAHMGFAADEAVDEDGFDPYASGLREVWETTVVGNLSTIETWFPLIEFEGGALHGDRFTMTVGDESGESHASHFDNATQMWVSEPILEWDISARGGQVEGTLHATTEWAGAVPWGPDERDYELDITFNEDGTAHVVLDAPTW